VKLILKILTFICYLNTSYASGFSPVVSISVGIFDMSLTENTSSLEATDLSVTLDATEAVSANAAVTIFDINYEFLIYPKKSFFFNASVPLVSSDGSGIFIGSFGANFYLNSMATVFSFNEKGTNIVIIPKLRYYWGASTGIGYLVYNTVSAKKSDIFFSLGLHAGTVYNFKKAWGVRAEVGISKATGVATNGFSTRYLVGTTYSFGL
jgi:hypothetical protein